MNKSRELIELINQYPEHELIFMYPEGGSDYTYTLGYPTKILVDEYWVDDDKVWLQHDNEDEYLEHYGELIAEDLYTEFPLSDVENKVVDDKLTEFINSREWRKCICVYIHY